MSETAEPTAKKQKVEADEAEEKVEVKEEAKDDEKKADEEEAAPAVKEEEAEEDEAPAEAAAPAAEDGDGAKFGELQRGDDGVAFIMLSAKKRVQLKKYRGDMLVDIREVYEKKGKTLPGKKGISLTLTQYEALRDAISKGLIDQEIEKLKS